MIKSRVHLTIVALVIGCIVIAACNLPTIGCVEQESEAPQSDIPLLAQKITIAAIGDVMGHMPQLASAWDSDRKIYDFGPCFSAIAPYLKEADLTIANLETVLDDSRSYHGYPRFNSPSSLAQGLKEAGVNVVTTANNHALDQGEKGLLNCLDHLEDIGLLHTGTFKNFAQREPLIISVQGFCIACLSYTTTTNGLPIPEGKEYLVNMWERNIAETDIQMARNMGAEFVVVSIHAGPEYQRYPSEEQRQIVQELIAAGADLVLGCHPHVVQPWAEVIKHGTDQRALIIYSLGNFFSNQYFPYTDQGIIMQVVLIRDPLSQIISIDSYRIIPTRVLREQRHTIVVDEVPAVTWKGSCWGI